jgi:dTDP-4-dehydrorhamnose 3,5-epimerase
MNFIETALPGVILIEPRVHRDERGFFLESYHRQKFQEGGIRSSFVQDNHSRSTRDTLRGLHLQRTKLQGKLIRVIEGTIFDVAVDVRRGSRHFAKWIGFELSAENFRQLYIPPGFAHGFAVTSDAAQVEYKCTEMYAPEDELTIAWDDPQIGIEWPLKEPLLSKKDQAGKRLYEVMELLPRSIASREGETQ